MHHLRKTVVGKHQVRLFSAPLLDVLSSVETWAQNNWVSLKATEWDDPGASCRTGELSFTAVQHPAVPSSLKCSTATSDLQVHSAGTTTSSA